MTLQARTVLNLIAGAIGGALAWAVIELTGWFSSITMGDVEISEFSSRFWLEIILGGVLGGVISLLLGLVDALSVDSLQQRVRGLATHTVIGFLTGGFGIFLGQDAWAFICRLFGITVRNMNEPGFFFLSLVGLAIGWGFIGAGVGIAQGIARRSVPLVQQGLFGGFAGGMVGGILFQSAASVLQNGSIARLLGFVCIGAAVGFFIGLIQTLFRQAWIRVVLGRNEGKEYLIDKPVTVIGRSELADIGLFGNAKILPHHCAVEQVQGRFRLTVIKPDASAKRNTVTPSDVKVNGLSVNPDVWLTDGDSIAIDDRKLVFREKLTNRTAPLPSPILSKVVVPPKRPAAVHIVEGSDVGRVYPLGEAAALIGRTEDCTVCLSKDTLISRRHVTLQQTDGQWSVTDCGSANGTFVNSTRLEPNSTLKIRSGDHIRVGDTVLRFEN